MLYRNLNVALAVPCLNEAATIATVVEGFRNAMLELDIIVFDNGSTDGTATAAKAAGAQVIHVPQPGKGNVVRRIFAEVEADVLVMVDGDSTYDAPSVKRLVDRLIDDRLDMVVGLRDAAAGTAGTAYRTGHRFGNRALTKVMQLIFGGEFDDLLSGYRAFSRRFVKSFPATTQHFEIETELAVHALGLMMPCAEERTPYGARPADSQSKLSTYRDGWRILVMMLRLFIGEKPLQFYSICAGFLVGVSLALGIPVVLEFLRTGLVPRFPTAILSATLMICALLLFTCALILDHVKVARYEAKRLAYLAIPHPANKAKTDHK